MKRRKLLIILAVAILLFTTVAMSSAFCDKEQSDDNFGEFSCERGSGGDVGICGGGDHPPPSSPQ